MHGNSPANVAKPVELLLLVIYIPRKHRYSRNLILWVSHLHPGMPASRVRLKQSWYSTFHYHVVHSLKFSQALLSIHDYDRARTSVAQLITGRKGEYIFRIGCQPSHASLFAGESVDDATGWSGVPRTDVEVASLQSSVKRVVEELGGKVCYLLMYRKHELISNRYPFFLRLLTATIHVQLYYYDYLRPALN